VAPRGTFIFDRHLSEDGSLYFKPVYLTQTFSLFLTTQKGRHVSVVVTPTTGQGQTLALVPNQAAKADIHWERNSGYLHLLQTMMLSMLQNKPLKGMQKQAVTESRVFSHSKHLQMQLTTIFSGGQLTGLVYRITNTSKYAYRLYERTFYRPGVRAVHLSQQLLKPHHSAWVYTLVAK
jgi:conjugal transfer pilus assembly protein TraK